MTARPEQPWSIAIARRVPSQNQFHYKHWTAYRKERDLWTVLLRAQLPQRTPPVHIPVRLTITSFRTRLCDYANLVGGAKPIPDCLIQLGWLKDDHPDWMEATYTQQVVEKTKERTEITWEPYLSA